MSQDNKILIVDDEKNIRLTLEKSLSDDYEVETAVNGEDALNKFKADEFDVVLLDMNLPGLDGMEVLKKIKEEDEEVKVIIITGYGSVETAVETMKVGAIDYLRKPFTPDEIKGIVKEVIERENAELKEEELNSYEDYLRYAKELINKQQFEKAKENLQQAVSLDTSKPEAFNLLGVIFEMQENVLEAQKKYRAALALDPTYKPAQDNLDRTSEFEYDVEDVNLGEIDGVEEEE
ncbi:sigma-54-dependent transcriptional regulator [Halanaerobacter jeridensis]|uniref:Stage 0 sporulation protein A homolog n=1 Tax=Halanaerobacter jeridensis TaxID=706427 RepID=A0A939BNM7_9FIRM|nr:response regulator [Halanaerobacter jeridensis]MBM7555757.1 DNA-binding NtrC family response regulator [Halanaerobacter jeridensis]